MYNPLDETFIEDQVSECLRKSLEVSFFNFCVNIQLKSDKIIGSEANFDDDNNNNDNLF